VSDRLAVLPQYLFPKRALTRFAGWVAAGRWGALTTWIVRRFVAKYRVQMAEAAEPDIARYASFNDFFTRALAPGARPLAQADWVCPVDGAISQLGSLIGPAADRLIQAKGHSYSVQALLGGDAQAAARYHGGHFATLYLSPRDYHRIHMPCAGELRRMVHVPGDLFSVNPQTARGVPGLFARNERVVCEFDTPHGPLVMALVGATIVGSVATTWHGVVTPPRSGSVREWRYAKGEVALAQGQEMGRFLLGSTVVLVWPAQPLRWAEGWAPERAIRLGEAMAQRVA
jgi:phosphatidylserine decarboxylase